MPNIGETEFDDPMASSYAGAGSPIMASALAPEVASPTPDGMPPGFGMSALPSKTAGRFAISEDAERALPAPPPGYTPGPLAPVRHAYEDSTLFRLGSMLSSYGESIPTNLKIKMAQQEADLAMQTNKLAWDNYYKSNQLAREQMQMHNRAAMNDFVTVLPNIKAQITSIADPELRKKFTEQWANDADGMYPGGGDLVRYFANNQAHVYGIDAILGSPDPSIAEPAKQIMNEVGYDNLLKHPGFQNLVLQQNRTRLNMGTSRFDMPFRQKMSNGQVSEDDFRTRFKEMGYETHMPGVQMAATLAFLDTPEGQEMMFAKGVIPDAMKMKKAEKLRELDPLKQAQAADYEEKAALLEDAKKNPGKYTEGYLKSVNADVRTYLGVQAKETHPGDNPNTVFNRLITNRSNGVITSMSDIDSLPKDQQAYFRNMAEGIQKEIFSASQNARMDMPHDNAKTPVFGMNKKGEITRVQVGTERDYRTRPDVFAMSDIQRDKMGQLDLAERGGKAILDQADKAYTAVDKFDMAKQIAAEGTMNNKFADAVTLGSAKKAYPEIAVYNAQLSSQLGKYARSLGGEVGVLTDQDILRVIKMFPNATDNKFVRTKKRDAFMQLIALNKRALSSALMGNKDTEYDGTISPSQLAGLKEQYSSNVNGILGSVEGLVNERERAAPSVNRGESLLDRMSKEPKGQ